MLQKFKEYYMSLPIDKLFVMFLKILDEDHWHPSGIYTHERSVGHLPFCTNDKNSFDLNLVYRCDTTSNKRHFRYFLARYIYLWNSGSFIAARRHLKKIFVSELKVQNGYDVFVKLTQVPISSITHGRF